MVKRSTNWCCLVLSTLLSIASAVPGATLESSVLFNKTIPVHKYKTKTGIKIVLAKTDGPLVNGYLCLATKANDDNGIPHTLEHLVLMGSEDYPYKGALSLIANRCYAFGTNAFTDIDRTCYYSSHVGKDGFLQLLPVFMDHVLYPTLLGTQQSGGYDVILDLDNISVSSAFRYIDERFRRESCKELYVECFGIPIKWLMGGTVAQSWILDGVFDIFNPNVYLPSTFTTEVYHVTGEGNDGGVVFSEQEAKDYDYSWQGLLRALHKDSGYASYIGGALKNLRENVTYQMNVDYHKKFYRADNLCITICGDVSIDDVMPSIKKMEKKILSKPKLPRWQRPWKTQVPALKTTIVDTPVASSNEGFAEVYIAWRLPNPVTRTRKSVAISYLMPYLGDTSNATDFFASSVSGGVSDNALYFRFATVPVDKLKLVHPAFHNRLKNITKRKENIEVDTIRAQIRLDMLEYSRSLENDPHDTISSAIVDDFVYGDTSLDFKNVLNYQEQLKFIVKAPASYWISLIDEYFIDENYAQSNGISSQAELDRLVKEDEELIPKRIEKLGSDGLKKKADELAKAIEINSRPVPDSVLTSVPFPKADNINYFDVKIYRTGTANKGKPPGLDIDSWPTYAEAYNCRTNYIYITATFFTDKVEKALQPYIYILLKLINDLPIQHGDEKMTALNDFETINSGYRIGLSSPAKSFSCGSFTQTASFLMQVQKFEYAIGVKYLLAKLQYVSFNSTDIKEAASKLNKDIPSALINENAVNDLMRSMMYKSDSNLRIHSMLYQKKFLPTLIASLDDEATAQKIVADVLRLRDTLISSSNLAFHITADFTDLDKQKVDLNGPWKAYNFAPGPKTLNVVSDTVVMIPVDPINKRGEIVGLQQQTSFLCQSSPGIKDYNDDDLAALTVALVYCTQTEGPMYRRVRGPGYSYSFRLFLNPVEGTIQFQLYRASDIVRGYNETVNIINERIRPDAVWEQTLFDSAKSAAVYQVVNRVPKLGLVQLQSMLLSFQKTADSYNQDLVKKILAVTIDDVKRVAQLYMTKIFSATEATTAIVCNAKEGLAIAEGLKKLGLDLQFRTSWEDSLLNKFG